jgi:hypothetical protein
MVVLENFDFQLFEDLYFKYRAIASGLIESSLKVSLLAYLTGKQVCKLCCHFRSLKFLLTDLLRWKRTFNILPSW